MWTRTTMKLKWKLFFLDFTRTKQQQKKGWRNNKLLSILQEQFASHWHKIEEPEGRTKYGKLLFLIIAFLQIEFELNISSWSQWNDDLIFSSLKFSFLLPRGIFRQDWKIKRISEIRFDFSVIAFLLKKSFDFYQAVCTHSRRKEETLERRTFSISLFSNFLFYPLSQKKEKNELGTAARTRDEEKIKFKDFRNPFSCGLKIWPFSFFFLVILHNKEMSIFGHQTRFLSP